jgi:hypothetical protein
VTEIVETFNDFASVNELRPADPTLPEPGDVLQQTAAGVSHDYVLVRVEPSPGGTSER